jgi:hypothetical protein
MKENLILLADGGHGPSEEMFRFAMGVMFLVLDLNVLHVVTNAGGQSKFNVVEQLNGSFAQRINGNPIRLDPDDYGNGTPADKKALLLGAAQRLTAMANGASFVREHVHVTRSEGASTWVAEGDSGDAFQLNEPELRRFLGSSPEQKAQFVAKTRGEVLGSAIAVMYRRVWGMMCDVDPENSVASDVYRRTHYSVTFRKRPNNPDSPDKPPRGSKALLNILDTLTTTYGFFPSTIAFHAHRKPAWCE